MRIVAATERMIFVYGTLLRGELNHGLLARARFAGHAATEPAFELADLGEYPAMLARGAGIVLGELYAVDPYTLALLDELEEHPEFYRRSPIRLATGAHAEAYLLAPEQVRGRPRIRSGNWRRRHESHGRDHDARSLQPPTLVLVSGHEDNGR